MKIVEKQQTADAPMNPALTWEGWQGLVWRSAAHQTFDFAQQVIHEGEAEYAAFLERFRPLGSALELAAVRFTPRATPFSFSRNWSEHVRELWQLSECNTPNVKKVGGSSGDCLLVPASCDPPHLIWTHNLGGCSAVALNYSLPDQTRALVLLHYNLTHIRALRERLFDILHPLELLTPRDRAVSALVLTPSNEDGPCMPRLLERLGFLLKGLHPQIRLEQLVYPLDAEPAPDKGTLIIEAAASTVQYRTWFKSDTLGT